MSKQQIGPREMQLRALREARAERDSQARKETLTKLRDRVASIPATKPREAKRKKGRKP